MRVPSSTFAALLLLALAVVTGLPPGAAHASGPPGGIVAYVPVTLTNSQSSPTATGFQQQLNVSWGTYSSYLDSNVDNVGFFTTEWSPLYAWCESSCSSTSTSSAVWVKLGGSTVPASGTLTIVMAFYPTSTNHFSSTGYWGEASDLSSTYGQYDNGGQVFLYYNNGQTTTAFTVANGGSLGTASMTNPYGKSTNVLALAGNGATTTSAETAAWYNTGVVGDNFVVDGWIDLGATTDGTTYNANAMQAVRGASASSLVNYILGEGWTGKESAIIYQSGTTTTTIATSTPARVTGWLWSTSSVIGSSLTNAIYSAPAYEGGTLQASTSGTNSNIGSSSTFVGIANWAGAAGKSFFYQWKVRYSPPGGVMPTPALGSVSSGLATPTAYSVPCSTSSSTFDMGQRVYGGFTVSGSGGTSWTLSYINQLGGTVQTTPSTSSTPYCDSVGYLIPSSGSSGAWTLEVQDASKIDVGQATFTVQNVAIPDLPSGIFLLLVPLALVYLVMRRRAVG